MRNCARWSSAARARPQGQASAIEGAEGRRRAADELPHLAQRWIDETLFSRSGGYVAQTVRWLDAYVYPAIGDMQLEEVQRGDVLAIIKARADTAVTAVRQAAREFAKAELANHRYVMVLHTHQTTARAHQRVCRGPRRQAPEPAQGSLSRCTRKRVYCAEFCNFGRACHGYLCERCGAVHPGACHAVRPG